MFDVQTPSFFRILQRQNDTPGPITDSVAFTVSVTGPNIQETISIALSWNDTEGHPDVSMSTSTDGSAGSADGLRYLRLVYPKRTGSGEPWRVDAAAADGTKRSISINVTTSSPNVLFDSTMVIPDWEADYNTTVLQIPEPATGGGGGGGDDYVPITRTVNGKALSDDIELSTSDLPNDSGFITSADVPEGSTASTVTPVMDGTANKGTDNGFARGDHVHPTDTSRQAKITASGILKGNGSGGVTAAVAGTDYLASFTETDPTVPSWAKASSKPSYTAGEVGAVPTTRKVNGKALSSDITLSASDVSALPSSTSIPSKTSDLTNDSGFITGYTETDPTVPSWAKQSSKPSYTAAEVGAVPTTRKVNGKALSSDITLSASDVSALPSSTSIPSKTSDLTNDSGFITGYTETDPTVPNWAKQSSKPSYTASEVGAVPTTRKVNGKALSADITLSASDVSALPSSTTIPTKTSELTNDSGFITTGDIPEGAAASTTTPKMDGTAATGSELAFARGDHVHPSDTSKLGTSGNASSTTVAFTMASSRTNIATGGTLATAFSRISKWLNDLGSLAFKSTVAKSDLASGVQTSLGLADTALQSYTETDPTVPSWAKQSSKPTYTASEVGALPSSTVIPSKTSDLTNDSGFITGYTETDPTVPSWAKASSKPSYTAAEVGAVPTSRTVNGKALSADISLTASDVGAGSATTVTTGTLTASNWSGSTYSALQTTYPAASYDIEIEPNGDSCTSAQYAAWGAAQLVGSATTNVLTALGTVPTVNIPIIIKVTAK